MGGKGIVQRSTKLHGCTVCLRSWMVSYWKKSETEETYRPTKHRCTLSDWSVSCNTCTPMLVQPQNQNVMYNDWFLQQHISSLSTSICYKSFALPNNMHWNNCPSCVIILFYSVFSGVISTMSTSTASLWWCNYLDCSRCRLDDSRMAKARSESQKTPTCCNYFGADRS